MAAEGKHVASSKSSDQESEIESPAAAALMRGQMEYWNRMRESGGVDIDCFDARGSAQLRSMNCKSGYRYPDFVDLYAELGLHRYNLLEGTDFQVSDLLKYNMICNCLSSYYMTLVATEPASGSAQTFQAQVDENIFGRLDLTVSVSRIRGSSTIEKPSSIQEDMDERKLYKYDELLEWPSEDAFKDRKRFYMVEEAELRDTEWISLYVKLVLCSKDKNLKNSLLSKLKILKVWIEAANDDEVEPPNARLRAKSAVVYVTFSLASCGIREHIERRAIVRRIISERTGRLILLDVLTPFKDKETDPYPWLSRMTPEDFSRMSQLK